MLCTVRLCVGSIVGSQMEGSEKNGVKRNGRICYFTASRYHGKYLSRSCEYGEILVSSY